MPRSQAIVDLPQIVSPAVIWTIRHFAMRQRNVGATVLWQMLFLLKIIALLVYLGLVNILVVFRVI